MSFLSNLLKSTDLLATNVFSWNVDFLVECMSQNGNAVFRDKVLETRVSPRRCWIVLALTGVYSGVMFDFLQVCPFTGIGFSTMFDFCKCVSFHRLLGCPLQCLTFTSVSFHWVLGCPRRLPLAFVTRQMEPLVERDPIQEHPVLSIVRSIGTPLEESSTIVQGLKSQGRTLSKNVFYMFYKVIHFPHNWLCPTNYMLHNFQTIFAWRSFYCWSTAFASAPANSYFHSYACRKTLLNHQCVLWWFVFPNFWGY